MHQGNQGMEQIAALDSDRPQMLDTRRPNEAHRLSDYVKIQY